MKKLLLYVMGGMLAAACGTARAQSVQHLSLPQKGGMPGVPVVTGISRGSNGVSITWDGPPGYYQVFQSGSLTNAKWQAAGKDTNLNRQATVNTTLSNGFFRVSGPGPHYAGWQTCAGCHLPILSTVERTAHAGALTNAEFVSKGGETNGACLACHTVGYGLATGFSTLAQTPKLGGVQCENCHGPATYHAANPDDPTQVPRVEAASTMCGGCHSIRYAEWKTSGHTEVIPNLNATNQVDHCGRCHSGTARLSLMAGLAPLTNDVALGIQCANCHDPHQTNGYPAQLRYPLASTNDYSMPTNGVFSNYYNASINVCGQCHNDAGASWTNSGAAPHLSPQYNLLMGTVGELEAPLTHYAAGHATRLTNQCVACHMQTTPFVSAASPGDGGHKFTVESFEVCAECHGTLDTVPQFTKLVRQLQKGNSNYVQELTLDLDYWATNGAPAALRSKYGSHAWEYTTPGGLSPGVVAGPNAAEQALIPTNIRKARFNVYIVFSDQSLGVHNPDYVLDLLDQAETWIYNELYP
ncbi:MAG: multiheme c-type cytochrome [Verrucomicrobiota bacterium]